MNNRRDFLKLTFGVAIAGIVGSKAAFADSGGKAAFPAGVVYTRENPGRWAAKVGSHLPQVSVSGRKVTVTTKHPMSEKHYIVRHTLVAEDGTILGAKTFYPTDKKAVSEFEVPAGITAFYATSFCNLHDFWVLKFAMPA